MLDFDHHCTNLSIFAQPLANVSQIEGNPRMSYKCSIFDQLNL
jgi:hypothetical protein